MTRELSERDLDTLWHLEGATENLTKCQQHGAGWCRPMDCGGSNGSHHSATLRRLAALGYADMKTGAGYIRQTRYYRINDKGRAAVAAWREARSSRRAKDAALLDQRVDFAKRLDREGNL